MTTAITAIKNLIASHLRGTLFGMDIYGQHELSMFDGKAECIGIIEVRGPSRFERYGTVTVYHPWLGKWIANLLSEHHAGKPVLVLSVEEIKANIAQTRTADFIYKVYGGETPAETAPVSWDPYWEGAVQ